MLQRTFQTMFAGVLGLLLLSTLLGLSACRGPEFTAFEEDGGGGEGGDGSSTSTGMGATSSTGGSSVGGTGGDGAGGGEPCPSPETKLCGTICVSYGDPEYGCGDPDSCSPCNLDHATAECGAHAVCAVETCDRDYDDCDGEDENGCEANLLTDIDTCGSCAKTCTNTGATCTNGQCSGPCGPIPATGVSLCWVFGSQAVPADRYIGLAGGAANPGNGEVIQNHFFNPRYVNPTAGEGFVLYDLGNQPSNADIQLRPAMYLSTGSSSGSVWDCGTSSCSGDGYVYQNGQEVGSYINGVASGVLTTVPHFDPPNLLNLKVDPL